MRSAFDGLADELPQVAGREDGFAVRNNHYCYSEGLTNGSWEVLHWTLAGREPKASQRFCDDKSPLVHAAARAIGLAINGRQLEEDWERVELEVSRSGDEARLRATLVHASDPLDVVLEYRFDSSPLIVRRMGVRSRSTSPFAINAAPSFRGLCLEVLRSPYGCAPKAPLSPFELGRFEDDGWGQEGRFAWRPMAEAVEFGSMRGRSGFAGPFFLVRNSTNGEIFGAHLAWSANWRVCLQPLHLTEHVEFIDRLSDRLLLGAEVGLHPDQLCRVLEPGEEAYGPWVHYGRAALDLDGFVQEIHRHLRRRVMPAPPGKVRPVVYNNWYATVGSQTEADLPPFLDFARRMGAEVFVFDAGWYPARDRDGSFNWSLRLGDWEAGESFPGGLARIGRTVRDHGLRPGLWMEPEVLGVGSQAYQRNPDWIMVEDGRPLGELSRYHLDFSNPAAAANLEESIARCCDEMELAWLKIDYNISIGAGGVRERGGLRERTLWRSLENWYSLLERVQGRYPEMVIETCSSGGGRNDLGMLARGHLMWISDIVEPAASMDILNGVTLAFPPEVCGRFVGAIGWPEGDLDFQVRGPMFGCFGFSLNPTDFPPDANERIRLHTKLYKEFVRPLLVDCLVYHHTPELPRRLRDDWVVLEYSAPDRGRSFSGVFRLAAPEGEYSFRPKGIDPVFRYRVTIDLDECWGEMDGLELLRDGIPIRLPARYRARLVRLEKV